MGLETVELIIEIEEHFQTSISDSELEKISTVGELYKLLIERIQRRDSFNCLTASMFYKIRRILINNYNFSRQDIRSTSLLNELIATTIRFDFWQKLERELSIRLPHLRCSKLIQIHGSIFPEDMLTVKDLVRECSNRFTISAEFKSSNQNLVWQEVSRIVGKIAYIAPDKLTLETNFARDLDF